jgi:N-acetylneuraminic acid mutarotase
MHVVRKAVSFFLFTMVSAFMLAGCKGSSTTTESAVPPTGSFSLTQSARTVTLTATGASGADSNPVTFTWNFGDQTVSDSTQATTGSPVTHNYAEPGQYDITLTITDDHGTPLTLVKTIEVTDSSAPKLGVENWSWIGGSKYANGVGVFETEFKPDPKNLPSARQFAATWYSGGKLWMFGGAGYDSTANNGLLNDLWYCTPPDTSGATVANCLWTWVAGSNKANASGIYPSAAGVISATSMPGGRAAAATWTDLNGNLWLFGGEGYDSTGASGVLNDMWSFSASGQSEWVSGPKLINDQGNATTPASRAYATTWTDQKGNFWLFGGQGITSSGTAVYLNDLWCFTPNYPNSPTHPSCANEAAGGTTNVSASTPITSGTWTQVTAGTQNGAGVYTATPTAAALPGARINAQAWVDSAGNFWMFGGSGYDSAGTSGSLNDVWTFNPGNTGAVNNKVWTYKAGSNIVNATEVTGTQGIGATSNYPSARLGTIGWTDSTGTILWLFGGSGSDSTATTSASDGGGALNELWAFNTKNNEWAFVAGTNTTIGADGTTTVTPQSGGVAGSAGIFSTQGTASVWNIPGSRIWSNLWVDSSNNVWIFGGTGDDVVGTSGYLNDLWLMQQTAAGTPTW